MYAEAQGCLPQGDSAIADFQTCALCAHRVLENRLSPSRLEANSPELLHTRTYILSVPIARLTYISYELGYRASDDIRSVQRAPNVVASAISQFVACSVCVLDAYLVARMNAHMYAAFHRHRPRS